MAASVYGNFLPLSVWASSLVIKHCTWKSGLAQGKRQPWEGNWREASTYAILLQWRGLPLWEPPLQRPFPTTCRLQPISWLESRLDLPGLENRPNPGRQAAEGKQFPDDYWCASQAFPFRHWGLWKKVPAPGGENRPLHMDSRHMWSGEFSQLTCHCHGIWTKILVVFLCDCTLPMLGGW